MKNTNSLLKNCQKQLMFERIKLSVNAKNVLFAVLFIFSAKTGYAQQSNLSQISQDANGNIGIGTTTPESKLFIKSNRTPMGEGEQIFPLTAEADISRTGGTTGFRIGLGLSTGTNNATSSQIQIKGYKNYENRYVTAIKMDYITRNTSEISFPTADYVKIPNGYLAVGCPTASTWLEIGQDNASRTTNNMLVHGGARFNNDLDVNNVTQVAINTNTSVQGAALTVGGMTYIGSFKTIEANPEISKDLKEDCSLFVEKQILAADLNIIPKPYWKDSVFESDYKKMDLNALESFVKENKHLPGIVSEKEVKEKGYKIHVFNEGLLQNVEELLLHIIDQNKKIEKLTTRIKTLEDNGVLDINRLNK
ncbi:hypothetical protein [Flavobacterium poyangense]|uniref:hypothetical protein n=1 Tax=Flavobacterium poyangense TaxID=2204302 RepID=UPI0014231CCC|nr:hypothetical protein [Flavobacterium sp. JXAS1]